MVLAIILTLVPFWYVVMISVTPLGMKPSLFLSPADWKFEAYKQLVGNPLFFRATMNSFAITLSGVAVSLIMTVLTAYPLSRPSLPGRQIFILMTLFTFLFSAGLIPSFLLVKDLHLYGTWWALILPGAVSVYNMFVVKAFFQNLPDGLIEAAQLDGASEFQILMKVVLPLSKPILLTMGLFYAVGYWNEFFQPILYLNDQRLMPLPVLLRDILTGAAGADFTEGSFFSDTTLESLKMAAVILSMLPMLMVYPWIQRYFTKGVLLGSVKE